MSTIGDMPAQARRKAPGIRGGVAVLSGLAVAGLVVLSVCAAARAADDSPATQAGSQPATLSAESAPPERPPGVLPMIPAATVEDALAYDAEERTILEGDKPQLNTPALYVLLRRAEMLPPGSRIWDKAEEVDSRGFWKDPQRYRGRLVMVNGFFAGRKAADWSSHVVPTRWWGTREVWMLDVVDLKTGKPILVALTRPPQELRPNQQLQFPAIFLKLVAMESDPKASTQPGTYEYPVVVARGVLRTRSPAEFSTIGEGMGVAAVMLGVLTILVVGFFYVRRHAASRPVKEMLSERRQHRRATEVLETEPEEVDEELVRQVEQAKAAKVAPPPKGNDAGPKNDPR